MDARHGMAIREFERISDELGEVAEKMDELKSVKHLLMHYIITFEGTCPVCQNGHWPHCRDKEE